MMEIFKKNSLGKSMFLSTVCKPLSMIISFLYTPILLHYLGNESFGVWSTLLSVINWINFFDIGIGNGLRNMLTHYTTAGEEKEANQAISTGYIALTIISFFIYIIGVILLLFLNVNNIFNTNLNVRPVVFTSFTCICINFILSLSKVQLLAIGKAEKAAFMTLVTQIINLAGILIISIWTKNNLFLVSLVVGVSGIIVNLVFLKGIWKKFSFLIPKFSSFRKEKLNQICGIGVKFFIIQISSLILYSTDTIIITQLFGPSYVTPYSTSFSAFGLFNGLFAAMISPLWAQYAKAYQNKNFILIKKVIVKLNLLLPIIAIILLISVLVFEPLSAIWLQKKLEFEIGLIPCMGIYYFMSIWGSIYSTAMNGMGYIELQLKLSVMMAVINIPLSIFLGSVVNLGSTGVLLATIICMIISNVLMTIDVHRYLNQMIKKNQPLAIPENL